MSSKKTYFTNNSGLDAGDFKYAMQDFDEGVQVRVNGKLIVSIEPDPKNPHGIIFVLEN